MFKFLKNRTKQQESIKQIMTCSYGLKLFSHAGYLH